MYKLLNASFFRLKQNKAFWGITIITIIFATVMVFNSFFNGLKYGIDSIFLNYTNVIGLFIATFTSLFVGAEYAYGTIRNKIIAGHSRKKVYLANLATSILVSIFIEIVYILVTVIIGIPTIGGLEMPLTQFVCTVLQIMMVIIVFSSIFNAITLICSDMTISTIICMFLFIAMFIVSGGVSLIINTPEYIEQTYFDEQGTKYVIESKLNPNYPSELKRNISKFIFYIMPTGQVQEITSPTKNINTEYLFLYSLGVIIVVNGIGIYFFNRKELK